MPSQLAGLDRPCVMCGPGGAPSVAPARETGSTEATWRACPAQAATHVRPQPSDPRSLPWLRVHLGPSRSLAWTTPSRRSRRPTLRTTSLPTTTPARALGSPSPSSMPPTAALSTHAAFSEACHRLVAAYSPDRPRDTADEDRTAVLGPERANSGWVWQEHPVCASRRGERGGGCNRGIAEGRGEAACSSRPVSSHILCKAPPRVRLPCSLKDDPSSASSLLKGIQ